MTPVERKYAMKYLVARRDYLAGEGQKNNYPDTINPGGIYPIHYQQQNKVSAIDQAIAYNVAFRMGLTTCGHLSIVEWNNSRNL